MVKNTKNIIIYGGNGFVGSHVAEKLIALDVNVTCASRSGDRPSHLNGENWANRISWVMSDASDPDPRLLSDYDVLVSAIGSPPIPTFSKAAYEKQLALNGTNNVTLIRCSANAGIKRLILVGAKIPKLMQRDSFAYAKGKRIALEAAQRFSNISEQHQALVLQPGGIYGTRYTQRGTKIPLAMVMGPLSKVMGSQLVAVDRLANCIVDAIFKKRDDNSGFQVIENSDL